MFFATILIAPATALPAISSSSSSASASIASTFAAKAKAFVASCAPLAVAQESSSLPLEAAEPTLGPDALALALDDAHADAQADAHADSETLHAPTVPQLIQLTLEPETEPAASPSHIPAALISYTPLFDIVPMIYSEYLLHRHATLKQPFVETVDIIVNKLHVDNYERDFLLGHDGAIVDVVVKALKHHKYDVDKTYKALTRKWFPFYKWYERQLASATPRRRRELLKLVLNMI